MAHAGFDAREAVKFWEDRASTLSERVKSEKIEDSGPRHVSETLVRRITGSSHPINEIRVERLKDELKLWEDARQSAMSSHEL